MVWSEPGETRLPGCPAKPGPEGRPGETHGMRGAEPMSKENAFLDQAKNELMPDVARCMLIAKKEYGKSFFS